MQNMPGGRFPAIKNGTGGATCYRRHCTKARRGQDENFPDERVDQAEEHPKTPKEEERGAAPHIIRVPICSNFGLGRTKGRKESSPTPGTTSRNSE